jgi:starch synthase
MIDALKMAVSIYKNADQWKNLMVRAMAEDWSWKRSAEGYKRLYRNIYLNRHPEYADVSNDASY